MTEQIKKPPLLNRILRCSACAKKLFYGISITVGLSITILLFAIFEIAINPHYVLLIIIIGVIVFSLGVLIYGAFKGLRAYCDKTNLYYDDFFVAGVGLGCCFGIFLISLAIYLDQGNLFELILGYAENWDHNNVQ